jgi:hypothetical protein
MTGLALLLCGACALSQPAGAQPTPIRFAAEIPPAPPQMEVYKLAPTRAPLAFLNETLGGAKLAPLTPEKGMYVARGATGLSSIPGAETPPSRRIWPNWSAGRPAPSRSLPNERLPWRAPR